MTAALVIARHKEDVSWTEKLHVGLIPLVITKTVDVPNIGREAGTYFHFIVENYNSMQGEFIFCQGNPFDHDPDFIRTSADPLIRTYGAMLTCDPSGQPQVDWTDIHSFCKVLGLPLVDHYKFIQGAQFKVHAEQIKRRPKSFYDACLAITKIEDNKSAWIFERLFCTIFGMNP